MRLRGWVAEWLCSGLQHRLRRFNSDPSLHHPVRKFQKHHADSKLINGGELMLVSDSKFLADDAGMSVNDNLIFLMNAVDYLAGDEDLISLRSREITSRPLQELENSTRKKWKWANMLIPSLLVLTFGFFQMRKEKKHAEILRQIYD